MPKEAMGKDIDINKEQMAKMQQQRKNMEELSKNWFPIDQKYSSVKDTPLTCTVKSGDNELNFKVDRDQ